jgi:NAD(P)-dependent dehydrogenase (short-subunit alcohol dehydrogenase family)
MSMDNETVVVVGGSSGIGLATVKRLAAAGARVFATGRDTAKLHASIAELGPRVIGEAFDARDRDALDGFFAKVGPFDHLVLALSGGHGAGEFAQLDLRLLRQGFEEKFWPQLEAAQAGIPRLRQPGSITFITAISATLSNPGVAGLGAINGALESMIGSLARELGRIRVNAVSPGVIDTPWWDRFPAEAKAAIFAQQAENPVGRVGQPEEVAQAVQFLIKNPLMTGAVIQCDGGLRLL